MTARERANQVWAKADKWAAEEIPEQTWNDWVRKEMEQAIIAAIETEAGKRVEKLLAIGGGEIAYAAREAEREACMMIMRDEVGEASFNDPFSREGELIRRAINKIRARSEKGE